jgi:hypothetical protein
MDSHTQHTKPEGVKLTAVSIGHGKERVVMFAHLQHHNGKAILPVSLLNRTLSNVPRGTTYSIG